MCMEISEIKQLLNKVLGENSDIISPLMGGMMNVSYIVKDKNDKKYVLYISTEQANEMVDRPLEKEHQRIINALGITSKNVYFDTKNGIKINEFIEGDSLDHVTTFNYEKVARLFKHLHASNIISREDYAPFVRFVDTYEKEALSFEKPGDLYNELRDFLFEHRDYLEKSYVITMPKEAILSKLLTMNMI